MNRIQYQLGFTPAFASLDDKHNVALSSHNIDEITAYLLSTLKTKLGKDKVRLGDKEPAFPNNGIVTSGPFKIRRAKAHFATDIATALGSLTAELAKTEVSSGVVVFELVYLDGADNGENLFRDFGYFFARFIRRDA